MNHEGNARRSAFFTAENELTRYGSAKRLRDYAEAVAAVVPLSTVVSIGRSSWTPRPSPALPHSHRPRARRSLRTGATSTPLPALRGSLACWRRCAGSIQATGRERGDQRVLADYERMTQPRHQSRPPCLWWRRPCRSTRDRRRLPRWRRSAPTLSGPPHRLRRPLSPPSVSGRRPSSRPPLRRCQENRSWPQRTASVTRDAAQVWRDPLQAVERIRSEIAADRDSSMPSTRTFRKNPHSYGELLGGRTVFLQPDAERKDALDTSLSPPRASTISCRPKPPCAGLIDREQNWRTLMATPVAGLSPEAKGVMSSLVAAHDLKRTDREHGHQAAVSALSNPKALEEIKTFHQEVEKRMAFPNAPERIPGMTPEKREEVKTVSASAEVAIRTAEMAAKVEQSREKEQDKSKGQGRDAGMACESPITFQSEFSSLGVEGQSYEGHSAG